MEEQEYPLPLIAQHLRASIYVSAAGLVMLIYDHILTFSDEVELIWRARWTTPKALFLILRYFVPPTLIIHMHQFSGLSDAGVNNTFCKVWFSVSVILGIVTMAIANFLVILHLWNLWQRNKRLIYSTCLLYLLTQVAHLVCAGVVIPSLVRELQYSKIYKCCILARRGNVVLIWAPGLVFEVVVFSLVAYTSLKTPRNAASRLSSVIYRDGLIFYIILVSLRTINVVLAASAPLSLIFLCIFFIWAAVTTTVTRMILRLRRLSVRRNSKNHDELDYGCSSFELKEAACEEEDSDGTGRHSSS